MTATIIRSGTLFTQHPITSITDWFSTEGFRPLSSSEVSNLKTGFVQKVRAEAQGFDLVIWRFRAVLVPCMYHPLGILAYMLAMMAAAVAAVAMIGGVVVSQFRHGYAHEWFGPAGLVTLTMTGLMYAVLERSGSNALGVWLSCSYQRFRTDLFHPEIRHLVLRIEECCPQYRHHLRVEYWGTDPFLYEDGEDGRKYLAW